MNYYAKLYINNELFYYYLMDDNDFKIDEHFNTFYNAFYENPIIIDDLNNNQDVYIDYISGDILSALLEEESLNDNAMQLLNEHIEINKGLKLC